VTKLEEIKSRLENITPGPWQTRFIHRMICAGRDAPEHCLLYNTNPEQDWPDADFIAHSREDVPWLIEQLEKAIEMAEYIRHTDDHVESYERALGFLKGLETDSQSVRRKNG